MCHPLPLEGICVANIKLHIRLYMHLLYTVDERVARGLHEAAPREGKAASGGDQHYTAKAVRRHTGALAGER